MVVLFVVCCIFWTIKCALILEQVFGGAKRKCYSIGLHDGAFLGSFFLTRSDSDHVENVAYSDFRKLINILLHFLIG